MKYRQLQTLLAPKALWRARKRLSLPITLFALILVLLAYCSSESKRTREAKLLKELQGDQIALKTFLEEEGPHIRVEEGSRGIVICAGGNMLLMNAYISVKVLRQSLNCTLPVQIFHHGKEEAGAITQAGFKELGNLTIVDLKQLAFPQHHRQPAKFPGYAQKIYSLYHTSFEQVLLLDADSQPLMNPESFFDSHAFRGHGNLLWSDFWAEGYSESPEEAVYEMLGLRAPWRDQDSWRCAESGQVLFDRTRHSDVLEWLWFINSHSTLLYSHMLGDKDTFEMAFMLAGKRAQYTRAPQGPGMLVSSLQQNIRRRKFWFRSPEEKERYVRLGMLQMDMRGSPAFLHRTADTKFNPKVDCDKVLRPIFLVSPISADLATKVREEAWHLHSVPASLATEVVTCDMVDTATRNVIRQVWQGEALHGPAASLASLLGALKCPGHALKLKALVQDKVSDDVIPLIPMALFGTNLTHTLDAGYEACRYLRGVLGVSLSSRKMSP